MSIVAQRRPHSAKVLLRSRDVLAALLSRPLLGCTARNDDDRSGALIVVDAELELARGAFYFECTNQFRPFSLLQGGAEL